MNYFSKVITGIPHLKNELRNIISSKTPLFISTPSRVNIYLDSFCNGSCIMCFKRIGNRSNGEAEQKYEKPNVLLLKELMAGINNISGRGVLYSFFSGEPLMDKALLFELMLKAREIGAYFSFTTNGYLLIQKTVEEIVQLSPFNIGISIESLDPSINEILRPYPNGTNLTLEGIERLHSEIRRQGKATSLNIKSTLTEINHSNVLDIVKKYGKRKGFMITPQPFEAYKGLPVETIEKLKIKNVSEYKTTIYELIDLKRKGYSINASKENLSNMLEKSDGIKSTTETKSKITNDCTIGNTTIFLNNALDVRLCFSFDPIGNLNSGLSIKDIWFGNDAKDIRQQISKCSQICTLSCLAKTSLVDKILLYLRR